MFLRFYSYYTRLNATYKQTLTTVYCVIIVNECKIFDFELLSRLVINIQVKNTLKGFFVYPSIRTVHLYPCLYNNCSIMITIIIEIVSILLVKLYILYRSLNFMHL